MVCCSKDLGNKVEELLKSVRVRDQGVSCEILSPSNTRRHPPKNPTNMTVQI